MQTIQEKTHVARIPLPADYTAFFIECAMIGPDFSPPEAPVAPKWQESEVE